MASAFENLVEGNKAFVQKADKAKLEDLLKGQHPYAIVVTCSDSRVVPEFIFNTGAGEIFVIRLAGNVACESDALASMEYAAEHLHVPLLVILGHSNCGAINAACSCGHAPGYVGELMHRLQPALDAAKKKGGDLASVAVEENVRCQIELLLKKSSVLAHLKKAGKLDVKGAIYDLKTGHVSFLQ